MYTIDIDTGGTFTDGFFRYEDTIETVKVPTTPHDVTECFVECIEEGAERLSVSTEELLYETTTLRFSTTIGTNMVIESTGTDVGLLVSQGAETDLYDPATPDPTSFLDPALVEPIAARADESGDVAEAPNREEVTRAVKSLMSNGARLVAVSLENAYYDPTVEQMVKDAIEEEYPRHYLGSVPVMLSSEVTDRPDDYLRTTSTVVNAYLHAGIRSSLYTAEDKVRDEGYRDPLLIGHASGGSARVAKTTAINTYNSGPACGVLGAKYLADHYEIETVISTDMGGTSIDLSGVFGGEYDYSLEPRIGDVPVGVPLIQVDTAGVGGGSIASVDDRLSVGPQSAGANPGPACYGRGGDAPTVTDADVVLGYINPDYFVGGEWNLDPERAHSAIEDDIAEQLGCSVEEAAWQIKRRADNRIAEQIRELSGDRLDGDASLLVYGGAGATHCVGYARELPIDEILLSPYSPVFSAFGSATLDVVHRYSAPLHAELTTEGLTGQDPSEIIDELVAEAIRDMDSEGFDEDELAFGLEVIIEEDGTDRLLEIGGNWQDDVSKAIMETIRNEVADPNTVGLSTLQVRATGPTPDLELPSFDIEGADPADARKGRRQTYWDGQWVDTPIYQREDLTPGNIVTGPAIVESEYTTYVVEDGWEFEIDEYDHGWMTTTK